MTRLRKFGISVAIVLSFMLREPSSLGQHPPPLPHPALPGDIKGKTNTYWLGPYVAFAATMHSSTVTWLDSDGRVKRRSATNDMAKPGFLIHPGTGNISEIVEGINEDWRISLTRKPGSSGFVTSTADSRVFVNEFHPNDDTVALDIYLHGKLTASVGPFLDYMGDDVEMNDDGSVGLLTWKDSTKTVAQAITFDPNGTVKTKVDCGKEVTGLSVAPGGEGVLISPNPARENEPNFIWYGADGRKQSLRLWPNPQLIGWIPKTHLSVFETSLGDDPGEYHLIDWDAGKELWKIPIPRHGHVSAIGLTDKMILFAAAELYKPGPWSGSEWMLRSDGREWIRSFYAVSVANGSIVSSWQAAYPERLGDDTPRFLWVHGKLYFLSPRDFTELNLKDIEAKRQGWK